MNKDIYKIKTADNYTDEEIVNILNRTESQKEYDIAIDRLYILRGDGKRRSKSDNVRTQQQMQRRSEKELRWTDFNNLPVTAVDKIFK
ncbi:hypothetical protein [uncultured Megasphaera sp.]|uniref:hypothetical protein n=1 Tax=uncultured Megasphaera sp. TaxID=165188 RepID=UPI00262D3CE2|nr:hypothetical protein [uncultured Megasphaera sp.]